MVNWSEVSNMQVVTTGLDVHRLYSDAREIKDPLINNSATNSSLRWQHWNTPCDNRRLNVDFTATRVETEWQQTLQSYNWIFTVTGEGGIH